MDTQKWVPCVRHRHITDTYVQVSDMLRSMSIFLIICFLNTLALGTLGHISGFFQKKLRKLSWGQNKTYENKEGRKWKKQKIFYSFRTINCLDACLIALWFMDDQLIIDAFHYFLCWISVSIFHYFRLFWMLDSYT